MATSNEYRAIPQDDSFRAPVGQRSYQNQPPMYTRYNTQPAPSVIIRRNRPNNYLFQAILVTLFCCCPFGTIGLCYSVEGSYQNQPTMYTTYNTQPAPVIIRTTRPNNYLIPAILVTLCCCCPFGTIGIFYSVNSSQKFDSGDVEGAESSANVAKNWSIAGLLCGLLVVVAVIILEFTVLSASSYGQE